LSSARAEDSPQLPRWLMVGLLAATSLHASPVIQRASSASTGMGGSGQPQAETLQSQTAFNLAGTQTGIQHGIRRHQEPEREFILPEQDVNEPLVFACVLLPYSLNTQSSSQPERISSRAPPSYLA